MWHFDGSSPSPRLQRGLAGAVVALGLAYGVGSELVAFGWDDPIRWIPDLIVGLTFIGTGIRAWSVERGTGALLTATGLTWFAGNIDPVALYWHRGPLIHLLIAYTGWRPRSRLAAGAVVLAYIAAVSPVWRSDVASMALSCALVAVLVRERARATGPSRHRTTMAVQAGVALGLVLIAGAVGRLTVPNGEAVIPALWLYEGALCVIAIGLYSGTRRHIAPAVTDLVVELGEAPSGTLRDALAHTLRDPSLQIGYWQPVIGEYVDSTGRQLSLQAMPATGRRASSSVMVGRSPY